MIYYNLSDNVYDVGDYELKPIIYEVYFSSYIPAKTKRWINWDGKFITQRYLKKAIESKTYQQVVLHLIYDAYRHDRHILLLAPRKEVLEIIAELLKQRYQIEDVGLFWSGKSTDELQHKVVLATTQIFSKGMDVPSLDTLIVLDQIADRTEIEQMIGRILRSHNNKKQPKVVFLVDRDFEIQHFLSLKRRKIYKNLGFEFQIVNV